MDDAGKRKARSAIGELSTRGMTNLFGGWFVAADAAAEAAEHDASLTPRVVILSHAQANEGIIDFEAMAHHAGDPMSLLRNWHYSPKTIRALHGIL